MNDIVYSVMVDPMAEMCVARHDALGPGLLEPPGSDIPEPAVPADPATMTDADKRAILAAGIRARGEDPISRAASA